MPAIRRRHASFGNRLTERRRGAGDRSHPSYLVFRPRRIGEAGRRRPAGGGVPVLARAAPRGTIVRRRPGKRWVPVTPSHHFCFPGRRTRLGDALRDPVFDFAGDPANGSPTEVDRLWEGSEPYVCIERRSLETGLLLNRRSTQHPGRPPCVSHGPGVPCDHGPIPKWNKPRTQILVRQTVPERRDVGLPRTWQ